MKTGSFYVKSALRPLEGFIRFSTLQTALLALFLVLGFGELTDAALLNFTFSFSSNPSPLQAQLLDVVPGTVTGLIEGLPATGSNVAAQSVIIEAIPGGLINGSGQSLPIDATAWPNVTVNSFTTSGGQVTAASFSGGVQGGGIKWIDINNGNGNNALYLNGSSSTVVLNPNGFAGVTFAQTSVPEPASLSLLAVGVLLCRRRLTVSA